MRLSLSLLARWKLAFSVVLLAFVLILTCGALIFGSSRSEGQAAVDVSAEKANEGSVGLGSISSRDQPLELTAVSSNAESAKDHLDPSVACAGVRWWKIEHEEMIPKKCFDALEYKYLDEDAGKYASSGMSFGKTITFNRIFEDPMGDAERVLEALHCAECWTEEVYWSQSARRENCHSESFASYGILQSLCGYTDTKRWRTSLQDHWVKARCQRMIEEFDESIYLEKFSASPLSNLMQKYYEWGDIGSIHHSILLLAVEMIDETAIGLSFMDSELQRKYAWKGPLPVMWMIPHWDELGWGERIEVPEIDHKRAMEVALDVAVGLEELGVEPNWKNLVDESILWVTTDTDTFQDAINKLNATLDPIGDHQKLRAMRTMQRTFLDQNN